MDSNKFRSRRDFLRTAFGTAIFSLPGFSLPLFPAEAVPEGPDSLVVGEVKLDRDIYDAGSDLNGTIQFHQPPSGPTEVSWLDSFNREVAEITIPAPASLGNPVPFSLNLDSGLTYANWIRINVNGVQQAANATFLLSPPPNAWDEYHVITWAHYPDGFYDELRKVGVDGTIAEREGDFSYILNNNFQFYVEQMTWEIFSIYIKRRKTWYDVVDNFRTDRSNLKLWVRTPCLNDPKTDEYVREHLSRYVRAHRAFRPLFYNIADELGQGWQIYPQDFCHSEYCTAKFAEYLRQMYGDPARVSREWGVPDFSGWDDDSRTGTIWDEKNLMINATTTDGALDRVAVAGLESKYGSISQLNQEWGVNLPNAAGSLESLIAKWEPVIAVIREARSLKDVDASSCEQKLGPLDSANERWGKAAGSSAGFQNWDQVAAFVKRFYSDLAQVHSTRGWNVTPWCDFRNFMDQNFADAVIRAAAVCKSEDPHARCGTEGGQSPFPFGWYNYEQVLRADDVIEPYNGGNNVEIIRSLKPSTIMVSTHGYEFKPGEELTAGNLLVQKQARRPVWWGLFHAHRGTLIWDDNLPNYKFIDEKTNQVTPAAETFASTFKELRRGIGKLFVNAQRTQPAIAIYYSPPSDQIHWLLDNVQHAQDWMITHGSDDRGSHAIGVRNSWTKVVEDLGLQYDFVSTVQVKEGKLNTGDYRVFIMPQSMAVSPEQVKEIREFVRRGGVLVADCNAATMNGHGLDLGHGQLDDVFGISRGKAQDAGAEVRGTASEEGLRLEGRALKLSIGDPTVTVTRGKSLARSGEVPLVIVNKFGRGTAIFLNVEAGAYCYHRLQPGINSSLPELMEEVFAMAEIHPQVRVLGGDGKRLPGTEVVIFKNGACEHVAIFRNPQFDDGGWGSFPTMKAPGWAGSIDNSYLEQEENVTIEWDGEQNTYDVRGQHDLGALRSHKTILGPWDPLVFTRSPQPLSKLQVTVASQVAAGGTLQLTFAGENASGNGGFRLARIELETPSGEAYDLYTRNALFKSAPHTESIPFAYNDPKGQWRVHVCDVMTGAAQDLTFELV